MLRDEGLGSPDLEMRFHLYYEGSFKSAREDAIKDKRVDHKHDLRREFHRQLKDLWQERKFHQGYDTTGAYFGADGESKPLDAKLAELGPQISGYQFVPLVHEKMNLTCSIDVLLLRRDRPGDRPGRIFNARDLDNRLKVLFDALKVPADAIELGPNNTPLPDGSDNPMFTLVQKDELISRVSVDTGDLLGAPPEAGHDDSYARVVLDVKIGIWAPDMFNLGYL